MFKLFNNVSKNEMKHTTRGIFRYKNRKPLIMLKGGHGNDNIKYLRKHDLSFKIDNIYGNHVRSGHIDCHKKIIEREKDGHMWFPKQWNNDKIKKSGLHVANLKKNHHVADHRPMHGKYDGVDVVAYKSKGHICGICPKFRKPE
ncbi:MAG: EndoU domain-containing protein [Bacilli bacterium]